MLVSAETVRGVGTHLPNRLPAVPSPKTTLVILYSDYIIHKHKAHVTHITVKTKRWRSLQVYKNSFTVIMGHFPALNFRNKGSKYQQINTFTKLTIDALLEISSVQHTEFHMWGVSECVLSFRSKCKEGDFDLKHPLKNHLDRFSFNSQHYLFMASMNN